MRHKFVRILTWIKSTDIPLHVVLIAITSFAVIFALKRCHKSIKKEEIAENALALKEIREDSVAYWRDMYEREHGEKKMAEGTFDEIQIAYGDLLEEKAKELAVKEKQISALTAFSTKQNVRLQDLVDKYGKYDTTYKKGEKDTVLITMKVPGTIQILDSLSISQYHKKYGFLNLKRTDYIDVVSYNKDTKITNLQAFRIKPTESKVRVRPVVSAIWNGTGSWAPAVGVGVEFKLVGIPVVVSAQRLFR